MKKLFLLTFIVSLALACKSQLVPIGIPQQFKGNFFEMKGYLLVDSAVLIKARDTNFKPIAPCIMIRQADSSVYFWNMAKWVKLPKFGDVLSAESDPTVSPVAKALSSSDTAKWNSAYQGRPVSLVFDSTSRLLSLALGNNSALTTVIKIPNNTAPPTDLSSAVTNTYITIYSSTGKSTTLPAASTFSAGMMSVADKVKLDNKLDSVRVTDSVLAKYRGGVIIDYDTIRLAGTNQLKLRNPTVGDTLLRAISATEFLIKSIIAGSNILIARDSNSITISSTGTGTGETTKGFSLGSGLAVFKQKSTDTLQFKSITASYGVTATGNTNDINVKVDTSVISPRANVGIVANSLADLKLKPGNASQYGITLGYFTPNDGGGALWRWNASSVATSDDMFIVGTGTGRWERIVEDNTVHIRSLGVYADDRTTEVPAIRTAFRAAAAKKYSIALDGATLNLNADTIRVNDFLSLINKGRPNLAAPNLKNGLAIYPRAGVRMENLYVYGFTRSVVQWDTLGKPTMPNRPIGDFQVILVNNYFEHNMRVTNEGSGSNIADSSSTAPRLVNSLITGNVFKDQGYGCLDLEFPYHNLVITHNIFDGVYDKSLVRQVASVGLDGFRNMDKETGLIFSNNTLRNILSTNVSERYATLLSGRGVTAKNNTFLNVIGSLYVRGEDVQVEGNRMFQDSAFENYAIITKDGGGTKNTKITNNIIRGKYGTGIYVDKRDLILEIVGNTIELADDPSVGQALVRIIGGDSAYQTVKVENNELYNRSTDVNESVIQITSSGIIRNTLINYNDIYSEKGGIDVRLAQNYVNGYFIQFNNNRILKMAEKYLFSGGNFEMRNNLISYPRGTYNGTAWVAGTYSFGLNFRGSSLIENNTLVNDTANTASTAKMGQLWRFVNATSANKAAGTTGGKYIFRNNRYDGEYITTLWYIEDSLDLTLDGEMLTSAVTPAPVINYRVDSKIMSLKMRNVYFPNSGTFLTTGLTAGETCNVDVRNSTLGATTLLSFTGASQSGLNKASLRIENSDLSASVAFGTGWATRYVKFKNDLNKKTNSSTAYTLALSDVKGGQVNLVQNTSASATTVTIPANSTTPFQLGDEVDIQQYAAGAVTVSPAAGVTIQSPNGLTTSALYQTVRLRQVATDVWTAFIAGNSGGGITTVNRNNTLIGDGGTTALGADTINWVGSKPWVRNMIRDSLPISYFSGASFTGNGSQATPWATIANVKSLESATTDGRIAVFNSTSGTQIRDTTLTGITRLNNGVVGVGAINLASADVTGTLPFASGGNGFAFFSGNTTSASLDLGIIPITAGTSGIVELYIVQTYAANTNSQSSRVQRRFIKVDRTSGGALTITLQSTPTFDLASASYAPTFTAAADISGGVKLTVGSSAGENTNHTVYYRVWPTYINN